MNDTEAQALAERIFAGAGPAQSLLMAMRLVLLVGQQASEDENVIEAAKDAISAMKRIGAITGSLTPS